MDDQSPNPFSSQDDYRDKFRQFIDHELDLSPLDNPGDWKTAEINARVEEAFQKILSIDGVGPFLRDLMSPQQLVIHARLQALLKDYFERGVIKSTEDITGYTISYAWIILLMLDDSIPGKLDGDDDEPGQDQ
jgi:hypothetical protein